MPPTTGDGYTLPWSSDCHALVRNTEETAAACATATTSRGRITAVLTYDGHLALVKVFRREGNQAVLRLQTAPIGGTGSQQWDLHRVNPEHDDAPKIAVVLVGDRDSSRPVVVGYDLIDVPGTVTLHRNLGKGAVRLAQGSGIADWSRRDNGYQHSVIRFQDGEWRIVQQTHTTSTPTPADGL